MSYPFLAHSHRYPRRSRRLAVLRPRWQSLRLFVFLALSGATLLARGLPAAAGALDGMVPGGGSWTGANNPVPNLDTRTLTVQQTQPKAILNWSKLNIATGERLHFEQQSSNWAALNRIHDQAPSRIDGAITAKGQVYLINQNGIIFGSGAQVNVRGLVASSLDITDQRFLDGITPDQVATPMFTWNGDQASYEAALAGGNGVVRLEAGAVIKTEKGGTVILLAPRVENAGRIETPEGQTILAAGRKVYLDFSEDPSLRGFIVEVDPFVTTDAQGNPAKIGGMATNEKLGEIIAERGNVTMAAYAVNQLGRVSATTSVRLNGKIILKAGDGAHFSKVTNNDGTRRDVLVGAERYGQLVLGEDSVTEIVPELDDTATITDSQPFLASRVELRGKTVHLAKNSTVKATGGDVGIWTARDNNLTTSLDDTPADAGAIVMDPGAAIDVSGTREYAVPTERNFVEVLVLGDQLKDSPLQRDGYLYRRKLWVDLRRRPRVIDVQGEIDQIARSVGEKTTVGGNVRFFSSGEVILRAGSRVDVSGGSLRYQDGYGRTSQLISQGGKVYDISEAPADLVYTGIAGVYTVKTRWGEREWVVPGLGSSSRYLRGYLEGKSAGKIEVIAHAAALDGALLGRVTPGPYQRDAASLPQAGELVIGRESSGTPPNYWMTSVRIQDERSRLLDGFDSQSFSLPNAWKQELPLSVELLREGGFETIVIRSKGAVQQTPNGQQELVGITLERDAKIELPVNGRLSLTGPNLDIQGDIIVPSGTVSLNSGATGTAAATDPTLHGITIGEDSLISTAGGWVNDNPLFGGTGTGPVAVDGGSVSVASAFDLDFRGGIDVSGGAWLKADGKLTAGHGGDITLKTGSLYQTGDRQQSALHLDGELRGYALEQGGRLTLDTSAVQIGGTSADPSQRTLLHLDPAFFRRGGFREHVIKGRDGLAVAAGAEVNLRADNFVLRDGYSAQPSRAGLRELARIATLPVEQRQPSKLTLTAGSETNGLVEIQPNAVLRTDAGGEIKLTAGNRMLVNGTIEAPAGTISLNVQPPTVGTEGPTYGERRSLWLGAGARLLARGVLREEPTDTNLRFGEVLAGGTVDLNAQSGYLVAEQGAVVDVSGARARLDTASPAGGPGTRNVEIASDAGTISLSATEGLFVDATLSGHAGGANAHGGGLAVTLGPEIKRNTDNFPDTQSRLTVRQSGRAVPTGLQPGEVIASLSDARTNPETVHGTGYVSLDAISAGGFDAVQLAARDRIEFSRDSSGRDPHLGLRRRLGLDTPLIAAVGNVQASLMAPYVSLANSWNTVAPTPAGASGGAVFEASGRLLDLSGSVGVSGFGEFKLNSEGDIRLRGFNNLGTTGLERLPGSLTSGGNLTLSADQIYATTMSDFALKVANNPDGTVTILQRPADAAPVGYERSQVLSAGARVTITAPNINHRGTLKAPFGEIVLGGDAANPTQRITVGAGATLSVSGEGQTVPFGSTQVQGAQWIYSLTGEELNTAVIARAPEKAVRLDGEDVKVESGATIDLSGGGDLYAYEFTPGPPGRSSDVLAPENAGASFAIVPWLKGDFAPYDPQYYVGVSGITPGDSVYLAGGPQLAAGTYALLPARYALLEGAYLVTPAGGYRDLPETNRIARADGSQIVSGYRVTQTHAGSTLRETRPSGFEVRTGASVRHEADYGGAYASRYFDPAKGRLPQDAGRLAFAAGEALSVEGLLKAAPANGGRGAEVDITANRIAIVGPDAVGVDPDFVTLDAASLTNLNAASLLFGGTRRTGTQGTEIDVTATQVVVANDAQNSLQAPEIMLVANDSVTLNDGAVVEGKGDARLSGADLVIQDNAAALVRVSSGEQVSVIRPAIADGTKGTVDIKAGAKLTAARSMILDGSRDVLSAGTIAVGDGSGTGALALGASRVSLGEAPAGTPGLVLSGANLDALRGRETLTLRASQGLDIYGGVDIGFNNLTIDAPRIAGYQNAGATTVLSAGGNISLSNKSNASATGTPDGTGTLRLAAGDAVRLGDGAYGIAGFADVTLVAGREIRAEGKGSLDVASNLTLEAPRVTAATGSDMTVAAASGRDGESAAAWHTLTLKRPSAAPATLPAVTDLAADLALLGKNVSIGNDIELPSGILRAAAKGTADTDNVTVEAGAAIKLGGAERAFADTFAYAPGGKVTLVSENGDVTIVAGASVNVAGVGAGDGGRLEISAYKGTAGIDGTIDGGAGSQAGNDAQGGSFLLDVSTLADSDPVTTDEFSKLNAKLNDGGFTESRHMRIRNGDLVIRAGNTLQERDVVQARDLRLIADNGAIDVGGKIDASGTRGGNVELWAAGAMALRNGAEIDASASGTDERGGSVLLATSGAGNAALTLETGSKINVTGTKKTPDGEVDPSGKVHLRAPRVDTDNDGVADSIAVGDLNTTITGAKRIDVEAFSVKTLAASESIAGTGGFDTAIPAGERDRLATQLIGANPALGQQVLHMLPGIEIRTPAGASALNVSGTLDLRNPRSTDGEPGVLTIRSAGDLNVNNSISDGFSNATANGTLFAAGDSWSYRLVAGADLGSAYASALDRDGVGNFTLDAGQLIRTGTGSIDVAAAGNIVLTDQQSVIYTAGYDAPSIADFSAPRLGVVGAMTAVYPTNGGDLRLRAGHDIIAAESNQLITDWQYRQGKLNTNGTIDAGNRPTWYPRFDKFEQGVGALGGGKVTIYAGNDISNLSAVIPTSGRLAGAIGTKPDAQRLNILGGGDLVVRAGGDILSGLYYVDRGRGSIFADGSVTAGRNVNGFNVYTLLALGDARIGLGARRDLTLGNAFNPTMITQTADNLGINGTTVRQIDSVDAKRSYFITYGGDSSVDLLAVGGKLSLEPGLINLDLLATLNDRWSNSSYNDINQFIPQNDVQAWMLFPPTLRMAAMHGDIDVGSPFQLSPAARGTLELLAGGSISIGGLVTLPDLSPDAANFPAPLQPVAAAGGRYTDFAAWKRESSHSFPYLHLGDPEPVRIVAIDGDITNKNTSDAFLLAKPAILSAGRDIVDLFFIGQNLRDADVTRLVAGRDIVNRTIFKGASVQSNAASKIQIGGPGRLELIAGRNVDLGASGGVLTRGNLDNIFLPGHGATVMVAAGMPGTPDRSAFLQGYLEPAAGSHQNARAGEYREQLQAYMNSRRREGEPELDEATALAEFKQLDAADQTAFLNGILFNELKIWGSAAVDKQGEFFGDYSRGIEALKFMFPGMYGDDPAAPAPDSDFTPYRGDINLFFSQIKTEQDGGIELFAPGGAVNAGLATVSGLGKSDSELGIVTAAGGPIAGLVWRDFLVNRSRVFTLQGGDILLWAAKGDIDAGRGARNVDATPPPRLRRDKDGNVILDLTNAIAGSGIAALQANPNVPRFNAYLFAPEGTINAGEAGIRVSGNLTLGAQQVLGADVIQAGGISTGVPTDTGSAAVGLVGVADSAASTSKSAESAATGGRQDDDSQLVLNVEVVSYGGGDMDTELRIKKDDKDKNDKDKNSKE